MRASSASSRATINCRTRWHGYRERYGNIQRLRPHPGGRERQRHTATRASKQADVLMLFYCCPPTNFGSFSPAWVTGSPGADPKTVDYYLHRTSHGSTLSGVVQRLGAGPR